MIDQKMNQPNQLPIEEALHTLFRPAAPDPVFVDRLEQQLLARQTAGQPSSAPLARLRRSWSDWTRPFRRRRLATAMVVLLLALLTTLTIIGPRRVLAGLQTWLGYVPGIGFLDLDNTRVLSAPIVQERNGVSLQLEQAIAGPEETILVLSSEGLPSATEVGTDSDNISDPVLLLEDGTTLDIREFQFTYGRGRLTFPPLPSDVYRATLVLERLPLVPLGVAPQQWRVPFVLQPASGELVAELFPQPYTPVGAEGTRDGVTLRVAGVAQTAESTAIQLEVDWEDPEWQHYSLHGGWYAPYLRDDLGHTYWETHENTGNVAVARVTVEEASTPVPDPTVLEHTKTFAAVSPSARQLTLIVDELDFTLPAEDSFVVDLGDNPQIGDRFPLDVDLNVAGFAVHISGAQLVGPDERQERSRLTFEIGPTADTKTRRLRGFDLRTDAPEFLPGSSGGAAYDEATDSYQLRAAIALEDNHVLPTGKVTVQVIAANVWLLGPWEVSWLVPNAPDVEVQPRTLHPESAITHDDVTLGVEAMTLTDRVTAVQFEITSPYSNQQAHPGRVLSHSGLDHQEEALYLLDSRGRRYEPLPYNVRWEPEGPRLSEERDPNAITFGALDPLARQVTLNVPAVAVNVPGTAVVEVTVPEGLTLHASEDPNVPKMSDPWSVDIPITMAGYPIHFTEAWLMEINPGELLLRLSSAELPLPEDGRWLTRLYVGRAVGPTGPLPESRWHRGYVGLAEPPRTFRMITVSSDGSTPGMDQPPLPRTYRAELGIEISAAADDGSPAGTYRIELDSADVQVDGPWQLEIDLP